MPVFLPQPPIEDLPPSTPPDDPIIVGTATNFTTAQTPVGFVPYIDGTPWTTIYYNRLVGPDNVIGNSNDLNDPSLRQYNKINNFELRVTDSNTGDIDPETNTGTITGSANIYPVITPISGDIFIASLQEGSSGIFEITSVRRYTHFKQSAWAVTYTLINYLNDERLDELNSYVTSEQYFDISLLVNGVVPLISKSEAEQHISKQELTKGIIENYLFNFFDEKLNLILYPSSTSGLPIYDSHISKFWNIVVRNTETLDNISPTELSIMTSSVHYKYKTILDAIIQQNALFLDKAIKHFRRFNISEFRVPFMRRDIFAYGISFLYFPITENGKPLQEQVDIEHPLEEDDLYPYIVSEAFYIEGSPDKTLFDIAVLKLIKREAITYTEAIAVYEEAKESSLEIQFYRIPVILAIFLVCR